MATNRESGFYWVVINNERGWEVGKYDAESASWTFCGEDYFCIDKNLLYIYDRRLIECAVINPYLKDIVSVLGCNAKEVVIKKGCTPGMTETGLLNLTKPEGHGMNPLIRNFYDSTT